MAFEIDETIKSMTPWKAPGSDGLHVAFCHKFWNIIKEEVTDYGGSTHGY